MTAPKRKRGRPPALAERYMLRLTPAEKRDWTVIARRSGLTLPQWIRFVCHAHVSGLPLSPRMSGGE